MKREVSRAIEETAAFHAAWSARSIAERKGGFKLALFRERRKLFRELQRDPTFLLELPADVLADWFQAKPGIGEATLRELMPTIAKRYLVEREAWPGLALEEYVNDLLANHKTADSLRSFLENSAAV